MYDMNIPLTTSATSDSSSSSSSSKRHKRRQLAHSCQLRLRELGYRGLAFTHTAYTGRLHGTRDDADIALPWDDLLFPPPPHRSSKDTTTTAARTAFGRMDERTGMRIYRRLNIIIEESGDISRLLLHDSSSSSSATNAAGTTANITTTATTSVQQILQKYDIVSIQPMNELVMQSICDLLGNSYTTRHDQFRQLHDQKERMNEFSNNDNNNNIHYIDIIVLEYATGSKGGYGLPYKLRKEYMQRILPLQSNDNNNHNIIFEINYATAMMDSKRRQGFIRTLLDLHIGYDSIQKKSHHHARHQLSFSNNSNNDKTKHDNKRGGNRSKTRGAGIHITTTTTTTKTKRKCFPCIISSGSRQDYTNGSDEGLLTFRTPNDINHYIQNLVGNSNNNSGTKVGGEGGVIGSASVERMLTHAYNRAMGVAVITTSSTNNKRLRGETTRSYVVVDRCDTVTTASAAVANNDIDDEDDEEGGNNGTNVSSLIDWLSSSMPPPCKRTRKDTMDVITTSTTPQSNRSMSNNDDGIIIPYHAIKQTSLSDDAIQHQLTISEPGNEQEESVVESSIGHVKDDDDIEDGYIAM